MAEFSADAVMAILPRVLREDPECRALMRAIAEEAEALFDAASSASVYCAIDALPEPVLDALADDLQIEWWRADNTLPQKRQVLKDSWYVFRHIGTKAAVIRALRYYFGYAVQGEAQITEWWEQNPYSLKQGHYNISLRGEYADEAYDDEDRFRKLLASVTRCGAILDEIAYPFEPIPPEPDPDISYDGNTAIIQYLASTGITYSGTTAVIGG